MIHVDVSIAILMLVCSVAVAWSPMSSQLSQHNKLTISPAKKQQRPAAGGFGSQQKKVAPPPTPQAPLQTTGETFAISEFKLPEGEGVNTMFMGAFMIEDPSVCDDLVAAFEEDPSAHRKGVVGRNGKGVVDPNAKESLEISFLPNDPRRAWKRYVSALQQVMPKYVEKYPYCANYVGEWGLSSQTNFQYYPAGGGYKLYHTERRDRNEPGASRHLVFMTYLNDVTDQGGTQFFHQNVTVQPVKGLTIVWPADWTFMHRGVSSPTEEKRIITGWFNFS
mmetsp:Transcript_72196/g.145254  ORF Transcript_72196/g.145254 Transcript_72196/m.145254 type:complete len:278 (+) Transcript_72196:58-891(+)